MSNKLIHSTPVIRQGNSLVKVTVYYNSELREYVCKLVVNGLVRTASTYYTDDKQDALSTSERMLYSYVSNPR